MSRKWLVLIAVACGTFMATLDASIVNIALSTLASDLNSDLSQVKWVVVLYFLIITALLLPIGKISDLYGRKLVFSAGFFVFTLGSAFCGLSVNLTLLLISRVIQAAGAAMLMANGPAIITQTFPARERGIALGNLAMVVSLGLISGPGVGGLLISEMGWRAIFLVNVPIGLIGMLLVNVFVKEEEDHEPKEAFDWKGSLLQMFFLVTVIILFEPSAPDFLSNQYFQIEKPFLFVIAAFFVVMFVRVELKAKNPVFDLSLIKIRPFTSGLVASFFIFVSYSIFSVLAPYFLERGLSYSTNQSGLLMTAVPAIIFFIAPISGRLSDHYGSRELCVLGASLQAAGLFAMAGVFGGGLSSSTGVAGILLGFSAVGLGLALFQSPNNNTVMSSVPLRKLGVASALIATVRNLGLFMGAGAGAALYTLKQRAEGDIYEAVHLSFYFAAFSSIAAMIASLGKESGPHWKEGG